MKEKQILIVGGGAAGLSAAVQAAEAGGHATVLEARKKAGGNGMSAEVVFALGSYEQQKRGISCDIDSYFKLSMEHSHYKNNARLLRNLLEASGETLNRLLDCGLQIAGVADEGGSGLAAATHFTEGNHSGRDIMNILRTQCEENPNIELLNETRAVRLLQEADGRVSGVVAETNGEERTLRGDAVLLATGGFAGNQELLRRIIPTVDIRAFAHLRGIFPEGDGLLMAEAAGAEILNDGCLENAGPTFHGSQTLMGLVTKRYALWLNCQGRRFVNEGIGDNFVYGCNAVYAQPKHLCYVLLDAKMLRQALEGPVDFLAGPEANANGFAGLDAAIEKESAAGRVCCSENLAEIAAFMGAPAEALAQEIADYNRFCDEGRDPVFLKPKALLQRVEEAPFLCLKCGVDCILTHGGIRVDEKLRVHKPDGSVLPGLFAAGADISGIDANGYQVSMGGHSFGFSLTGGRLAALAAMED